MKAFSLFLVVVLLSFILVSCSGDYYKIEPKDKESATSEVTGETTYIVNISSYSYHLSSCHVANKIKDENKIETKDIDFILEREYVPCQICIKSE